MAFLKLMHDRDTNETHCNAGGDHASFIAAEVAGLFASSVRTVCRAYNEWRAGEREKDKDGPSRPGSFCSPTRGKHERDFLLKEEDLKSKFKKWMRTNLRKLSVDLVWGYLNTTLLKKVDDASLASYGISLPISRITAWAWMKKSNTARMDCNKTYCNDQHQKIDVGVHRLSYILTIRRLQRRMHV